MSRVRRERFEHRGRLSALRRSRGRGGRGSRSRNAADHHSANEQKAKGRAAVGVFISFIGFAWLAFNFYGPHTDAYREQGSFLTTVRGRQSSSSAGFSGR